VLTGVLATSISAVATNGTGRCTIFLQVPPMQMILATPNNTIPMFGVAQGTATT
jgi:hypothetical protein